VTFDFFLFHSYFDRWGVTLEQTENLQTINVCLNELDRSDLVIGMLGERYGWHNTTENTPTDLILDGNFSAAARTYPWIDEYRDRSVTELELLFTQRKNIKLFAYLRDPASPQSQPEADEPRTELSLVKLGALKDTLRAGGFVHKGNYQTPKEAANLMLQDVTRYIEETYPIPERLSTLEQERELHRDTAEYIDAIYVERSEQAAEVHSAVFEKGANVVVSGEVGVGKSAFVAHAFLQWLAKDANKSTLVFAHFAQEASSAVKFLRRILLELQEAFGFGYDVSFKYEVLRDLLPEILRQTAARCKKESRRVIIILDSVDLLDQTTWLPENDAAFGVQWVFSCTKASQVFPRLQQGLACQVVELPRMQPQLKTSVIEEYLTHYSKKMSEEQVTALSAATQTEIPAYLVTVLNELNVVGNFKTLLDQINEFLSAGDIASLYEKILRRLEQDVNLPQRPSLVADVLSSFALARHGLTELEAREINDVPPAIFGPLRLATSGWFVGESLLRFKSAYLEGTVKRLHVGQGEAKIRERILNYFECSSRLDTRRLQEAPWQLVKLGRFAELRDYVYDLEVFLRLREDYTLDLIEYHQLLASHYAMGEVVLDRFMQLAESSPDPRRVVEVGMVLVKFMTIYHNSNADNGRLINAVVEYSGKRVDRLDPLQTTVLLEQVLFVEERLMDYDRAYQILDQVMELRRLVEPDRVDDMYNAYLFLCGDACKYKEMGHWLEQLKNSKQPLQDAEKGGWGYRPYALALFEAVYTLKHTGDFATAERCLNAAADILKSRPPIYSQSSVHNWLGQLRRRQGQLLEAKACYERALDVRLQYFGSEHIEVIKVLENLSIVRQQIDPNDPEISKLRRRAFEFRKKYEDWSYCMCCDVYIDFKHLEDELQALASPPKPAGEPAGSNAKGKQKEEPPQGAGAKPMEVKETNRTSVCAGCAIL